MKKKINNVKKEKVIVIMRMMLLITIFLFCGKDVYAAPSGGGTSNNPYLVSKFNDLEYALTTGAKPNAKTYIQVSGTINMKKNINVDGGSFCIYAKDKDATIRKSTNPDDKMNSEEDPRYCIRAGLTKKTDIEIGCQGNGNIILGGQRKYYESNNKVSSGWLYVGTEASVMIGSQTTVQNMINNDPTSKLSNLSVYGSLYAECEIKNCTSLNGGAICVKGSGIVRLGENAKISNCTSNTEGGAIWVKENGYLIMEGGQITKCTSAEEGGAIFVSGDYAKAEIISGTIDYNISGNSAGGVFAGYGATLIVGSESTDGPAIEYNEANGSGGGIRANGGLYDTAGGTFHFYSGRVNYNKSKKYGGGISIGSPGKKGKREAFVCRAEMIGNSAEEDGGGICIPKDVGYGDKGVRFEGNVIKNNYTKKDGGGIYVNSSITGKDNFILGNESGRRGGGIYIGANGKVSDYSSHIGNNRSSGKGKGIYLAGKFQTGGYIDMYENNEVYICKDKYIENNQIFLGRNRVISKIDSERTGNGTKIVLVNFGETAEMVLYGDRNGEEDEYKAERNGKKFEHNNLSDNKLLRSTGMVKNIDNRWIIISSKYRINYNKNISKTPHNMPANQIKFYEEDIYLSNELPNLEDYEVVRKSIWNGSADGKGRVYGPGAVYKDNSNLELYVIWKLKFVIDIATKDRYYVVGQKIILSENEVLKKISVTDSYKSNYPYKVIIKKIYNKSKNKIIFQDNSGMKENNLDKYLSTKNSGNYQISIYCENKDEKKIAEKEFCVYVLTDAYEQGTVRFISSEYLYTLNANSIWRNSSYYDVLVDSIHGEKEAVYFFTKKDIEKIREFTEKKKHKMGENAYVKFFSFFLKGREKKSGK